LAHSIPRLADTVAAGLTSPGITSRSLHPSPRVGRQGLSVTPDVADSTSPSVCRRFAACHKGEDRANWRAAVVFGSEVHSNGLNDTCPAASDEIESHPERRAGLFYVTCGVDVHVRFRRANLGFPWDGLLLGTGPSFATRGRPDPNEQSTSGKEL
jgi:hypothetical protein